LTPGGAPERIVQEIEWKRRELGSNFRELEQKVRDATDWRSWIQRNPLLMMGVGLGAGMVLARFFVAGAAASAAGSVMDRRNDYRYGYDDEDYQPSQRPGSKGALTGVAVKGAARFLAAAIPALREYNRARTRRLEDAPAQPEP